jgi:cytochrome c oxidase subunit 4
MKSKADDKPDVHTLPLVKEGPAHGPQAYGQDHDHAAGVDHVPHVLPLSTYIATWLALIVLTALTVAASYFNFGTWNLVIALLIATTKASVVAAIFMHLRYDRKFHTIIFSFSLIFLGIFIAFTMFDTETRGRTDSVEADRPVTVTTPFAGGKAERDLKERYTNQPLEGGSAAKSVRKIPVPTVAPAPAHK